MVQPTPLEMADQHTLDALDFQAIRDQLSALAQTDNGRDSATELTPHTDRAQVAALLQATSEMRGLIAKGFSLDRVADPHEALARARRATSVSGEELRLIGLAIMAADTAVRAVRGDDTPALAKLVVHVRTLRELGQELTTVLGPRGEVLDLASKELARLRRAIVEASDAARTRSGQLMRSTLIAKALQDSTITLRDNRYVLPIKVEFASQVPGIIHDTSASGQTVFIEPLATIESNNRVRTARIEEQHEIERILTTLTGHVTKEAASIVHLLSVLTAVDLAFARARLAEQMDAHPAILSDEATLRLDHARHPLLGRRAVAQSFELDAHRRFIIISGPNMGGKTVALKLAGLAVLMTACGLHLPAEATSVVGLFTHVRADIGDAQSIAMNASTFSAHLGRLRDILEVADDGLLFLVDEIAGGTEPAAGAALAIAILDRLLCCGAHGIVTTHAQELKAYAQERDLVENAGMRFATGTHKPTFELDIGVPGRSLAFDLAAREGLDAAVLDDARSRVDQKEHSYDRALAELSEARAAVSEELQRVRDQRHALQRERDALVAKRDAFDRERKEFTERAEQRLGEQLRRFASELAQRGEQRNKGARVTRSQSELMTRTLEEMRKDLKLDDHDAPEPITTMLKRGTRVRVRSMGSEGVVADDFGDTVAVTIGSMRTVVSKRECIPLTSKPPKRQTSRARDDSDDATQDQQALARISNVATELDVRGKRLYEAQEIVDRWLDTAVLAGFSPLRIIHGKGTGALGTGLQQALRGHPSVKSLRFGNETEGGSGVTIVAI